MQINFNAHGAPNQGGVAFAYILVAEVCLVAMGHFVKVLSTQLDTLSIFLVVQVFSALLLAPIVILRGVDRLKTARFGLHLARCLFGLSAMFLMFYAYQKLDISLATLLKLLSPVFIPFVAVFILGERLRLATLAALAIAVLGVWWSSDVSIESNTHVWGVSAACLAALFAAFGKSIVRRIGRSEDADVIAFYFSVYGVFIALPLWLFKDGFNFQRFVSLSHQMSGPKAELLYLLVLVSILATIGQYTATVAYTKHRAAIVGLFTYLALPIAGVVGAVWWNEDLNLSFWLGSLLILLAGIVATAPRLRRS